MKPCYSKSYSPEIYLDYERQVMLQRCFVVVFEVSEYVLQPLSDAYVLPAKGCNLIKCS